MRSGASNSRAASWLQRLFVAFFIGALIGACDAPPPATAGAAAEAETNQDLVSAVAQANIEQTCTVEQERACAAFGTQCVDNQCSGGFGEGHGCTAREEQACAAFGTQCVDHRCSGGFGEGDGCTARERLNCEAFGTQCVDHKCSGGFGMGSGCTAAEQLNCGRFGCGCADHQCSGGFCAGDGCTAREQIRCGDRGFECREHECVCDDEVDCPRLACPRAGSPGPINPAGASIAPTGTYTDWSWPTPVESMEWDLQIEHDIPNDGYFWSHQFWFENGPAGYFGLQAHGIFLADRAGPVDITKTAVFSIGGEAIRAELGDFPYPNGVTNGDFDGADGWSTMVRFEWRPCEVYRLRVTRQAAEPNGDTWIAAFIRDPAQNRELLVSRILVPAAWGRFASSSVVWTERFGYAPLTSCSVMEHASAIFGVPSANGGTVRPSGRSNHFYDPPTCPNSRFTDFPDAVRQEMGVRP